MPKANDGRRNDLLKCQLCGKAEEGSQLRNEKWDHHDGCENVVALIQCILMSPSIWVLHRIHTIRTPLVILLDLHICAYTYVYIYIHCIIYLINFKIHSITSMQFTNHQFIAKKGQHTLFSNNSLLKLAKSLFPLWGKWSPQRVRRKVKELELPDHLELGAATLGAPHLWNLRNEGIQCCSKWLSPLADWTFNGSLYSTFLV